MSINNMEQLLNTHNPISGDENVQHWWDEDTVYAVIAAVSASRPLLVLGEPGLGKSQIAAAAAHALGRAYLSVVVHGQLDAQDLLWSFDYTARLADSQLKGGSGLKEAEHYLCPGPLWWAINPENACTRSNTHHYAPPWGKLNTLEAVDIAQSGTVLLIDEIDKADIGVANSLLETLGDRSFNVPHLKSPIKAKIGNPYPLIVFTSNKDRELPAPFLRRCTVLHLDMPGDIKAHFQNIGQERYPMLDSAVLDEAADQIIRDRGSCPEGGPKTGLGEYLDLLEAVAKVTRSVEDERERAKQQLEWLGKLSRYFFKHRLSTP